MTTMLLLYDLNVEKFFKLHLNLCFWFFLYVTARVQEILDMNKVYFSMQIFWHDITKNSTRINFLTLLRLSARPQVHFALFQGEGGHTIL